MRPHWLFPNRLKWWKYKLEHFKFEDPDIISANQDAPRHNLTSHGQHTWNNVLLKYDIKYTRSLNLLNLISCLSIKWVHFCLYVSLTTYGQLCYLFKSLVYSIQHYMIKFVSDLQQVGGFLWVLRCPPLIKLTATI